MPPDYNYKTDPNTIGDIVELSCKKFELRSEIDYALNRDSKINAIKLLKEELDAYHKSRKYKLRICKDSIDKYKKRLTIQNKINMLKDRIESWCELNGYEKMDTQKEIKDNKTGEYIYRYSDWEMIDDHDGLMINDSQWLPSTKQLKQYNQLWKRYEKNN